MSPYFSYERMPRYQWPNEARSLDTDCCTKADCDQRYYNRMAVLSLEKLTEAYASLMLLQHATAQLWQCDDEGHTEDCPNLRCRYAKDRADDLIAVQLDLIRTIYGLYESLAQTASDLSAQWQGLYDVEQAGLGIRDLAKQIAKGDVDDRLGERMYHRYLTVWQEAAVGEDTLAWSRWFEPPVDVP